MTDVVHDTFVLTRSYPKPPAAVFDAFADPQKKRRWYANHANERYEGDFCVGGAEISESRMGDDTPFPGALLTSDARYLDIVQNDRVVMAQTMAMDGRRFSASLLTFEFRAAGEGTTLIVTHQAGYFEGSDGPEIREHGWGVILDSLDAALA